MAAGLGFKTFTTGEVLTAADVNGYLMQGVLVFATAAARNAAITSPQEGQFAFTKDTNGLWYYDGAAWVASGATGDIEGVTAGVGISGGGTSGTVTVTNSMATEITAAGDIIVGTGSGTFDNLPIGTTAQVLTADTTVSPYKVKWATPAGGGGKVLQVVQGISSGYIAITSSNTYTDANLSLAITPTLNTSKILIFINQQLSLYTNTAAQPNGGYMKILRGSTDIWIGSSTVPTIGQQEAVNGGPFAIAAMTYLDSPATTSSTTYKTQWKQITNSYDHTLYMNYGTFQSTITLMEIGA
jgi:hypothetical protein